MTDHARQTAVRPPASERERSPTGRSPAIAPDREANAASAALAALASVAGFQAGGPRADRAGGSAPELHPPLSDLERVDLTPGRPFMLSAPGERIIFNCEWKAPQPEDYEMTFTASAGAIIGAAHGLTTTLAGLRTGNVYFDLPKSWDGAKPVTVDADVRKRGRKKVLDSVTWTFHRKKGPLPTTIKQINPESESPISVPYEHHLGPDVPAATPPFYEDMTIFERFPATTCNITVDELTDDFKAAHPAVVTSEQINDHFFETRMQNGTFVVDEWDKIFDDHDGCGSDYDTIAPHLKKWKAIHSDHVQVYEATPGVTLGTYTIRKIIKGEYTPFRMRKFKTP